MIGFTSIANMFALRSHKVKIRKSRDKLYLFHWQNERNKWKEEEKKTKQNEKNAAQLTLEEAMRSRKTRQEEEEKKRTT